jgi:hypothetical protein
VLAECVVPHSQMRVSQSLFLIIDSSSSSSDSAVLMIGNLTGVKYDCSLSPRIVNSSSFPSFVFSSFVFSSFVSNFGSSFFHYYY